MSIDRKDLLLLMMAALIDTEDNHKKIQFHTQFDTIIVFGEGPVKPLLLSSELTQDQKVQWEKYKTDPMGKKEPSFWLIDESLQVMQLFAIEQNEHGTLEEKAKLKEQKRQQWQHTAQFALKRFGKENALAAGLALYAGITKTIILSGGKTMPGWMKKKVTPEQLQAWPSEAELMKDIILKAYDKLYFEKYGRFIEDAIIIEDQARNTLENFAYSLNIHPKLLEKNYRVGLLTARHHVKRVGLLSELFSLPIAAGGNLCAPDLLKRVSSQSQTTSLTQPEYIQELEQSEKRWRIGLQDPRYVSYWCGYVAEVKYPTVVQGFLQKLKDPKWVTEIINVFRMLGVNHQEYRETDLVYLYKSNPEKYTFLVKKLQQCKTPEYRKLPPPHIV